MSRQVITFAPADRPAIEVQVDGRWEFAVLRQWVQDDEGAWTAQTDFNGGNADFPSDRVRPWPEVLDPGEAAERPDKVVFRLRMLVGPERVADIAGVQDTVTVADWANGRTVPERDVALRLLVACEELLADERGDSATAGL